MFVLSLARASLAHAAPGQTSTSLGEPPFLHVRYPTRDDLNRGLAAGDLDGDGDVDLAVCRNVELLLMWGNGEGWIERTQTLAVASDGVALGDLDGDGDADLATVARDHAYVMLGLGGGAFSAPTAVELGPDPSDVMLADLDLDGDLDLVAVCAGSVRVLLGDHQGGFSAGFAARLDPDSERGALGDLNEDGWLDLIVNPGQQLLFGNGLGGFVPAGAVGLTSGFGGLCLADFDGDGHLDLLVCDSNYALVLGLGDGSGTFPKSLVHAIPFDPARLAVGDLDGDGDVDVVCKSMHGTQLGAYLNDGTGALVDQGVVYMVGMAPGVRDMELVDLDGNGDMDLASTSSTDVTLLAGDGAGWFLLPQELPGVSAANLELADVNGDGHGDLVCAASEPKTLLGDGQGGFGPPLVSPGPGGSTMALGDLNGDGAIDLVLGGLPETGGFPQLPGPSAQDDVAVCLGDGTGRFPAVRTYNVGWSPRSPALADLDGDGDLDIAVASSQATGSHGVALMMGEGNGEFVRRWLAAPVPSYESYQDLALGDVDRDGYVDIVAVSDDAIDLFLGTGQGAFGAPISLTPIQEAFCVEIADLDQDALPDLVVGGRDHGVSALWGQAGGGLSPPEMIEASLIQPRDLQVADVNGDGAAELVVAGEGNNHFPVPGGLAVLRRIAAREFQWTWTFGHGNGPWSVAAGDVDGNGRLDLLTGSLNVQYSSDGDTHPVSLLLNQLAPELGCTSEIAFCSAKINSAGCLPRICSDGSPTISGPDDFAVRAERVLSHQAGLLIWGRGAWTHPFQGGTLCIAPPLTRTPTLLSGGTPGANDCSGAYSFLFSHDYMTSHGLAVGVQVFTQFWSRDPFQPPPTSSGLTDALSFSVAP